MGDTPLTALCSVCHVAAPKYRCPRCGSRTCSLACVSRHKAWSSCSGVRDPTVFVPASRLRTPAGIDHDYNFLSAIERARGSAGRNVLERTGIAPPAEGPTEEEEAENRRRSGHHHPHHYHHHHRQFPRRAGEQAPVRFRKEWRGDELVHVPLLDPGLYKKLRLDQEAEERRRNAEGEDGDGGDGVAVAAAEPSRWFPSVFGRPERARCRALDIEVVGAPPGMARQRENRTKWHKRAQGISWTTEWLVYACDGGGLGADGVETTPVTMDSGPTRILHSALDTDPIYRCFAATMDWVRKGREKDEARASASAATAAGGEDDEEDDVTLVLHGGGGGGNDANNKPSAAGIKKKKKRILLEARAATQNPASSAWPPSMYPAQNPFTAAWDEASPRAAATASSWNADELVDRYRTRLRYFLLRPATNPKCLVPLGAEATLSEALVGRTVLEFPTVCVLPAPMGPEGVVPLPPRHVLGSAHDRRPPALRRPSSRDGLDASRSAQQQHQHNNHNNNEARPGRPDWKGRGNGRRGGGLQSRWQQQQPPLHDRKRRPPFDDDPRHDGSGRPPPKRGRLVTDGLEEAPHGGDVGDVEDGEVTIADAARFDAAALPDYGGGDDGVDDDEGPEELPATARALVDYGSDSD